MDGKISKPQRLLITGASGLVGSHLAEATLARGIPTVLLVRDESKVSWLKALGAEIAKGELTNAASLQSACRGVTHIVQCAAKVGDWGPAEDYLKTNLDGLKHLISSIDPQSFQRFIHISSLGVYASGNHEKTDESTPMADRGMDGYTHSKIQSEAFLQDLIKTRQFPAVVLRPGFIYGKRDQTILPKLIESLRIGRVRYLGNPDNKVNNTYVGNLVDAILLTLSHSNALGQTYNITDPRLVSKREFMETICTQLQIDPPTRKVPYGIAKRLASVMEMTYRILGKQQAPLLSQARVKFLGANLNYSSEKAKRELGYAPHVDFTEAMQSVLSEIPQRQAA